MAYAYEDMTLPAAIDLLASRGRDHTFREAELRAMAESLAARTLAIAALGEALPDRSQLDRLRGYLPPGKRRWEATVLSKAVLAVSVGAPVSPCVRAGTEVASSTIDSAADSESLGRRIITPGLIPTVALPNKDLPYPVIIEDATTFSWDSGSYRFNHRAGPSARLRNANLRLMTRGHELSYDGLVEACGPLIEGPGSGYASVVNGYNTMADLTPFIERARRSVLPTVDPAAIFVDIRDM